MLSMLWVVQRKEYQARDLMSKWAAKIGRQSWRSSLNQRVHVICLRPVQIYSYYWINGYLMYMTMHHRRFQEIMDGVPNNFVVPHKSLNTTVVKVCRLKLTAPCNIGCTTLAQCCSSSSSSLWAFRQCSRPLTKPSPKPSSMWYCRHLQSHPQCDIVAISKAILNVILSPSPKPSSMWYCRHDIACPLPYQVVAQLICGSNQHGEYPK
jgi:hypothetical protein